MHQHEHGAPHDGQRTSHTGGVEDPPPQTPPSPLRPEPAPVNQTGGDTPRGLCLESVLDGQPCSYTRPHAEDELMTFGGCDGVTQQDEDDEEVMDCLGQTEDAAHDSCGAQPDVEVVVPASPSLHGGLWKPQSTPSTFSSLPNELLFHILGFLDVCDLLSTSRVSSLLIPTSCVSILSSHVHLPCDNSDIIQSPDEKLRTM